MHQVRIVIADDHSVVRMGLKALLHQKADLQVVGEASTGEEAIQQAVLLKPDIVVMDIHMAGISGIDACRKITELVPDTRVVMLTSFAEKELLFAAVRAGAAGYVLKRIGNDDLLRTIRAVAHGQSGLDLDVTEAMFKRVTQMDRAGEGTAFRELTTQESRILACITEGLTNRQIATKLFLAEGTVRNHVSNMLSKLFVANRAEAAALATRHRLHVHMTLE